MTSDLSGALLGIGNPLLDISAEVELDLLKKYNLKANDAILAEDKHATIYDELTKNYQVLYTAGGATQNSIRGAQRLLPPNSTVYIGCIGKDLFGNELKNAAEKDGLKTEYMIDPSVPTGVCATLLTGYNRSMVTNLLAANNYNESHLKNDKIWQYVKNAKVIYSAGFFLTVSPESVQVIGKHASEENKIFASNLSAAFITQFYKDALDAASQYWDILFGNDDEALAYAETHDLQTKDLKEIALHIANLPKHNTKRSRIVVFTHAAEPTIIAQDGQVTEFPVYPVPKSEIIDTNGAGDAFVGGFLSELVRGSSIEKCVAVGHWLASIIIKQSGVIFPEGELKFPGP